MACVLLGGAAAAQPEAGTGARIYGLEIDKDGAADRLLVFADGPVEVEQVPVNAGSAVLVFPGAQLDPSAPNRLRGPTGSRIRLINLFERKNADPPEVRLVVQVRPGNPPTLSERGSVVALVFPPAPGGEPPATTRESGRRSPRRAGATPPAREPTFPARMLGVTLEEAVKRLAAFLEEPIILTDALRQGTVNVDTPEPVTRTEARGLLEALLLLKGFALAPTPGGVLKAVPITGDIGPWVDDLSQAEGQMLITTLVKLEAIEADLVIQAIQPLIGGQGIAIPMARSNAIILAGAAPRLERLAAVIRELDRTGPRKMAMLRLDHADATEIAAAVTEVMREDVTGLQVWPDARTNRIVVRGRPDKVEEVRGYVRTMDREPDGGGQIQVIPILFANVDRVAEMLRSMQAGADGLARGAGSLAARDFALSVHNPSHSLVVQGDPQTISLIRSVLEEIDVPPARIDVDVTVQQVALADGYRFGLSFLTPLLDADDPDDLIAFVVSDSGGTILPALTDPENLLGGGPEPIDLIPDGALQTVLTYDPLSVPIFVPVPGIGEVPISLAASAGIDATQLGVEGRLLLRPRLSLLNGEEHEIFTGNDVPIPVSNTAQGTGALQIQQNIERQQVGVTLRLRPTVTADDIVDLDLDLVVSNVARDTSASQAVEDVGIAIQERTVATRARLRPGRVAVVAYATGPQSQRVQIGTPYLQSIPFIGWFFKRVEEQTRNVTLLVTARARVYRPEVTALTQWIQRSLAQASLDSEPTVSLGP